MDNLNAYKIDLYDEGNSIGNRLKYHRLKAGLTQDKLAEIMGLSNGVSIKSIELNQKLISRKLSNKLANYFNIGTKFFYDDYLEDTDMVSELLKSYRIKNNLSIPQICEKLNISKTAWRSWENSHSYISRSSYAILKKNNIL